MRNPPVAQPLNAVETWKMRDVESARSGSAAADLHKVRRLVPDAR